VAARNSVYLTRGKEHIHTRTGASKLGALTAKTTRIGARFKKKKKRDRELSMQIDRGRSTKVRGEKKHREEK